MRCLSIGLLLLCVHCSSEPSPATPAGEATGAPAAPPPAAEPPAAATGQPSAEASSAPAPGALKNPPSKQPCEKLDKSTCKVTVGCAWNDKQKCITEETH